MALLTRHLCRFVKMRVWGQGLRFLDPSKPLCLNIMKDAMKEILHITDTDYLEELFPWFSKLFMDDSTSELTTSSPNTEPM